MKNVNIVSVQWQDMFKPIAGFLPDVPNRLDIEREVIPNIFVPGVMGSRMKNGENKKIWDPDDHWFMLNHYGRRKAKAPEKRALLIGKDFEKEYLSVLLDDAEHNKKFNNLADPNRAQRGWGGVSWSSYGEFLEKLQNKDIVQSWAEPVGHCFEFPVHAFGYNWTASNRDSGEKLAQYIDQVIAEYQAAGRICEKVILITHSMGGLVARSACMLHGAADKVLGVIHGVQPARGAAAAYWRMKGGFERPGSAPDDEGFFTWKWWSNPVKYVTRKPLGTVAAWVLGTDGEEVTALLGNMPGGLELLPNQRYTDNEGNKAWLKYPAPDCVNIVKLPERDPYEEIYLAKDKFYRLINPQWLNPGSLQKSIRPGMKSAWQRFVDYLGLAKSFHHDLGDQTHTPTYQFYSEGLATLDSVTYQRHISNWQTKLKRIYEIVKADLPGRAITSAATAPLLGFNLLSFAVKGLGIAMIKDSDRMANRGGFRGYVDEHDHDTSGNQDQALFVVELDTPTRTESKIKGLSGCGGDGTVPISSGAALQCKDSIDINKDDESYLVRDHEPIYKTKTAQKLTFTAIENICRVKIKNTVG